ncbi:3-deoxy-D-manno-octulosonic acid kinase [Vibrio sp. kj40-1]|uniref:3-deoxy-D-manno-octulosonic acid kinase n=1 Tax=Vibrio algarum TaxID=3020714 RepID=A0ABT4YLZ3_9VIBR|nr:3-deoxy-D-manno-octulosonic acid kinase [Vibrio sp. KJ40-1]MDB1122455.1 3-deoxy-D-manno-octulosonic acid kinase [Vibrio sp. KJ40-1]
MVQVAGDRWNEQLKTIKKRNERIWYDEMLLNESPESIFDPKFWENSGNVLGSAQGRGTTWFVQTETIPAALRHYRRGGLFGKLVKDHYIFTGWDKTRSYQEFQLLLKLIQAGVNVPRPIAARAYKSHFSYQADLLSEKIENARDLVSILQQRTISDSLYHEIGKEIKKMHDTQVNHTDLNIHNILVDDTDKVWIIDFDKCCVEQGDNWKADNLSRLKRSFVKEVGKRSIKWSESDWGALFSGYGRK